MPRVLIAALAALALLVPVSEAQAGIGSRLSRAMAGASSSSSAYVMDSDTNRVLFARKATVRRSLASNTKLFTTSATLGRLGETGQLATTLVGTGALRSSGTWDGNLYLRGGGDPTFGARSFNRDYGSDASPETLAAILHRAGFTKVTGHVYGDESLWDTRRGGPESGYGVSPWVGPLGALNFDHGYGKSGFLSDPASYAAERLDSALGAEGIKVKGKPGRRAAPGGAYLLAEVRSPSARQLIRLTNKPSDNWFAEMLGKGLSVDLKPGGPARAAGDPVPPTPTVHHADATRAAPLPGPGTSRAGARAAARFARTLGATPHLVDGSGMSRADKASPRSVALLLDGMRARDDFQSFYDSLPIAGRDGTLDNRMRHGAAAGRCHGKTGTLTGVSALSGYCTTRGGRTVVFSILMNGVGDTNAARSIQDRMANTIAGWRG
jgi:D-alanyl-D-alanine carboxypeptidase/D-alanyl-D-alanine-endopeptidase (penicillin-binding protein 4)